jgi:uncharacterized protein YjeT (DUF2065 family)
MVDLAAALGLALVIEGAAYALFPQEMKRLVAMLVTQPEGFVRIAGLAAAVIGLMFVILAKGLP